MPKKNKIIIVGAGPGGLTAGMLLSHRGFDVHIYEKDDQVGGRNQSIEFDGFKHDLGPTFLMMKFILDEVFEESGKQIDDYLNCTRLDPLYRLQFNDFTLEPSADTKKTKQKIAELFPDEAAGFDRFLEKEAKRFKYMYPCLQKSYHRFWTYFEKELRQAAPYLSLGRSMFGELGKYFKRDKLKLSFTFQSKYLGMAPWDCPAAFMIIPYIEHKFGIFHVEGGLSEISQAMAKIIKENKGKIKLKTPVKKLIIKENQIKGVELENGKKDYADEVVINADFAYAMEKLAGKKTKKYSPQKLAKKKLSCSTFMLYLNLDKIYRKQPHHSIVFSENYRTYVKNIFKNYKIEKDLSFYIRNAAITDKTVAPKGKSGIYVLVPVPNNRGKIKWTPSKKRQFRDQIIKQIEEKTELKGLSKHIISERIVTPNDWEQKHNVYQGATFNLAHTIDQMLYLRPHNLFEEFENCYLVGGGTHPGSGLPTIYESGRITSNLISRKYGVNFTSKNLQIT